MRNRFLAVPMYHDGGEGSGGSAPATPPPAGQQQGQQAPSAVETALSNLMNRNGGDAGAVAALLFNENKGYRDEIRELKKAVPGSDAVVLPKADADVLSSYRALGEPAALQQAIAQGSELEATKAERDRAFEIIGDAIDEQLEGLPEEVRSFVPAADAASPLDRLAKVVELKTMQEAMKPARPGVGPVNADLSGTHRQSGDRQSEQEKQVKPIGFL